MADVEPLGHSFLCGSTVLVAGYGVAGRSAVRALRDAHAFAHVTADGLVASDGVEDDVTFVGPLDHMPDDPDYPGHARYDHVIVSPGYPPTHPLLVDSVARGVPVWGEVEFAWQLRGPDAAPWLALTGTNGKTTTVHMLEAMLRAAGLRALAVGNVGESLIDAVRGGDRGEWDVLAVELSSQQLHFAPSIRPAAGALLNLAPDHLSWHGSLDAYEQAKTVVWHGDVAVANADDARVMALAPPAAVTFTLGPPAAGQLGVSGDQLVSRAFGDDATVLADVADVRPAGRHNVANALAAAALVRAHGLPADAVTAGLRAFVPDPHRNALVTVHDGVTWVDDSKATNPHAADASLSAYGRVVWVAGGQLKGVAVDELVRVHAHRLVGAVLLGVDRAEIAAALSRHAREVPVITVDTDDDGAMIEVVRAATGLARPGDTVLLAPAAASYDMFADFGARGDAFAAAVRTLAEGTA